MLGRSEFSIRLIQGEEHDSLQAQMPQSQIKCEICRICITGIGILRFLSILYLGFDQSLVHYKNDRDISMLGTADSLKISIAKQSALREVKYSRYRVHTKYENAPTKQPPGT